MHKKLLIPIVSLLICLFIASCKEEEYYLDDMDTDDLVLQTAIEGPITNTSITFEDFFDVDGVGGTLYGADGNTIVISEHTLQTLNFPLTLKSGSKLKLNKVIEDLDPSDMFGEDGFVDSLGYFKLNFTVTNTLPFAGVVQVKPVVSEFGETIVLPDPNVDNHKFDLSLNEKDQKHVISFDNSDSDLLSAANALILYIDLEVTGDTVIVNADDLIKFYLTTFISGRMLINNF